MPGSSASSRAALGIRGPEGTRFQGAFKMMDMTTMSTGMTVAMVLVCVIILAFVVLGIAAFIKYLRS
jgi:hypothetical protein